MIYKNVAPCKGAWIEINPAWYKDGDNKKSLPARERGLK